MDRPNVSINRTIKDSASFSFALGKGTWLRLMHKWDATHTISFQTINCTGEITWTTTFISLRGPPSKNLQTPMRMLYDFGPCIGLEIAIIFSAVFERSSGGTVLEKQPKPWHVEIEWSMTSLHVLYPRFSARYHWLLGGQRDVIERACIRVSWTRTVHPVDMCSKDNASYSSTDHLAK